MHPFFTWLYSYKLPKKWQTQRFENKSVPYFRDSASIRGQTKKTTAIFPYNFVFQILTGLLAQFLIPLRTAQTHQLFLILLLY